MKCQNCGAELAGDAKFCRECGTKVTPQNRFCRECGAQLATGVKFYSECGAKVDFKREILNDEISSEKVASATKIITEEDHRGREEHYHKPKQSIPVPGGTKIPKKSKKRHKKNGSKLLIIFGVLVVLIVFNSLKKGKVSKLDSNSNLHVSNEKVEQTTDEKIEQSPEEPVVETNYKIEKGTQYAFMSDEWNVYIAEAISDEIIKIEAWDKTLASTKKLSYDSDIGSYKINDPVNGFSWIDDEHTAFTFIFQDKNNSRVKKLAEHIFTINISDSDKCKGSDYDEHIACFSYKNDDWHMYRAIPLTDSLIKIECWARSSSLDKFLFGWDWCVIDIDNNDKDFEWTDDEHTSFTLITKDPNNKSYWKNDEFVVFELENPQFNYSSVRNFLDGKKVDDATIESAPVETQQTTEELVKETEQKEKEKSTESELEPEETQQTTEKSKVSESVSYSTNTQATVKNGNSGVYAYKKSGSYDLYYIIDFDEGYVYCFSEGNGDESCERVKIESGDLNDVLIITYHDGSDTWSYGLHFKYVNNPDHLVIEDNDHFEYDYYSTNLNSALKLRDKKKMYDY